MSKDMIGCKTWSTMQRAKWIIGIAFAISLLICIPICLATASAAVNSPTLAESLFSLTELNATQNETISDIELGGNESSVGAAINITDGGSLPSGMQLLLCCYR